MWINLYQSKKPIPQKSAFCTTRIESEKTLPRAIDFIFPGDRVVVHFEKMNMREEGKIRDKSYTISMLFCLFIYKNNTY